MANSNLPDHLKPFLEEVGEEGLRCKKCNAYASTVAIFIDHGKTYAPRECIQFSCSSRQCYEDNKGSKSWAYCKTCKKRMGANFATGHAATKKHKDKHNDIYEIAPATLDEPMTNPGDDSFSIIANNDHDSNSIADMSANAFVNKMDEDFAAIPSHDHPVESQGRGSKIGDPNPYPKMKYDRNEWLMTAFAGTRKAMLEELTGHFDDDLQRDFWFAEHASPPGFCGGGLQYLITRAFQNSTKSGFGWDPEKVPSFAESRFHMENFIQFYSMNDEQLQRQSRITNSIIANFQTAELQNGSFFQKTHIPDYKELNRIYGKTGTRSIWNSLPIPQVENIDGVAYTSPIGIVKFVFANALPVDDIVATIDGVLDDNTKHQQGDELVHHVEESWKTKSTIQDIISTYHVNQGIKKAIVCWLSDWKDGFGPSRTKNNRGSVDACTITVSPPKNAVNTTDNTFLVAVGLKKSKGWIRVSQRFRDDLMYLTSRPHLMYHGALQKMVPVFFKRFASIQDKIERADSTGTIGCGSDYHRTFGCCGKIETPKCKREEVKEFLSNEAIGLEESRLGWSSNFLDTSDKVNGLKFPSCNKCRRRRLIELGVLRRGNLQAHVQCKSCSDWEQCGPNKNLLEFKPSPDYPSCCRCIPTCNCPVEAPAGREVGLKALPQVKMTFAFLKEAVRFAFYHCSKPTNNWTKGMCKEFLRACGVQTKHQEEIHTAAVNARGTIVDYTDELGVGTWKFPAAWSSDIALHEHIEAIMHLLSLGIAKSILELATMWMKDAPGMSSTAFRKNAQELLKELKQFQLSWLLVYPFGKEGYKTGAWVAENWLAFVRIAPILFAWCCKDFDASVLAGFRDVARVILSLHAVAARVMTHGGVNDAFLDTTKAYMKEFLSSVRELDIRLRYEKLSNVPPKNRKEKGSNESFFLKSNFMSMLSVIDTMKSIGPIVLWMDGGGKGERFIQEVKPHIKRGVREDQKDFFVILAKKIYKERQIGYLEKRYGFQQDEGPEDDEDRNAVDLLEALQLADDDDNNGPDPSDDDSDYGSVSGAGDIGTSAKVAVEQSAFSKVEDEGMLKKSTIYIYRNEQQLRSSIEKMKPLSGILQWEEDHFAFYILCRRPVKQFARYQLVFDDNNGLPFLGMWYASLTVGDEPTNVTSSLPDIKSEAKMSAVAIPLWYMVGKKKDKAGNIDRADAAKFCVITNWWKVRNMDGEYVLPELDPAWYNNTRQALTDDQVDRTI